MHRAIDSSNMSDVTWTYIRSIAIGLVSVIKIRRPIRAAPLITAGDDWTGDGGGVRNCANEDRRSTRGVVANNNCKRRKGEKKGAEGKVGEGKEGETGRCAVNRFY